MLRKFDNTDWSKPQIIWDSRDLDRPDGCYNRRIVVKFLDTYKWVGTDGDSRVQENYRGRLVVMESQSGCDCMGVELWQDLLLYKISDCQHELAAKFPADKAVELKRDLDCLVELCVNEPIQELLEALADTLGIPRKLESSYCEVFDPNSIMEG